MIYGLIPVGGKGTRLSLPFPKELLPQKGFDFYNPLINHIVEKMLGAGADVICFVHGSEFKQGIVDFYNTPNMQHIKQITTGFANVISDFFFANHIQEEDQVLFGLPDSIFEGNPFHAMLIQKGIVCGLFSSDSYMKVDRLAKDESVFQVKVQKNDTNQNWFWGVIKFDGADIIQIMEDQLLEKYNEIGNILNQYPRSYIHNESYLDLGTWANYNRYLSLYRYSHDND
jgi:dTDP-glucose pyrophosphorylase